MSDNGSCVNPDHPSRDEKMSQSYFESASAQNASGTRGITGPRASSPWRRKAPLGRSSPLYELQFDSEALTVVARNYANCRRPFPNEIHNPVVVTTCDAGNRDLQIPTPLTQQVPPASLSATADVGDVSTIRTEDWCPDSGGIPRERASNVCRVLQAINYSNRLEFARRSIGEGLPVGTERQAGNTVVA